MPERVSLVRDADASAEGLRETFRDIKEGLRVPVIDLIFQAYAVEPRFVEHVWRRIRPNVATAPFADAARSIIESVQNDPACDPVGDLSEGLAARGFAEADVRRMHDIVEYFVSTSPRMTIIAAAVDLALRGQAAGGGGAIGPRSVDELERTLPDFRSTSVPSVDEREAPLRVRTVLDAVRTATGIPSADGLLLAMGAYPDWLEVWWQHAAPTVSAPVFKRLCERVIAKARVAAHRLPYTVTVDRAAMRGMGVGADALSALAKSAGEVLRATARGVVESIMSRTPAAS